MHRFHLWWLREQEEQEYEWEQSDDLKELHVGESFELTLVNQYGEQADALWVPDCEGVVEVDGTTITAVGEGTVTVSCEFEGQTYGCIVRVRSA